MSSPPPAAQHAASFSTFAGMHTNEDWSSVRAQEEAAADGDDEIVQELPVVLSQELAHTLYLMQSPLRPPHRSYDSELGERVSLQVKPIQKKVEMQYRLPEAGVMYQHGAAMSQGVKNEHARGANFDEDHEYGHVKTVTLQGKNVQPKTNYAIGVLSNGVLHLTPISAVCRFRPQLGYIDEAQAAAAASSEAAREAHRAERMLSGRMTEEEELEAEEEMYQRQKEEDSKKELQTVVMKVERKRGGAAGAAGAPGAAGSAPGAGGPGVGPGGTMRKQTYAYIKALEESEKWIPLKLHEQDTPASSQQYQRLLASSANPPPIPFNVPAQSYLSYVNPPDATGMEGGGSAEAMFATGDPLYLSFDERILHFMRNARMISLGELAQKMQISSVQLLEQAVHLLQSICWVVQGAYVLKSSIVFDRTWKPGMPVPPPTAAVTTTYQGHQGGSTSGGGSHSRARAVADRVQLSREFLLTQFARHRVLYRDELMAILQLELEPLDLLLNELATCTPVSEQQKLNQGVAPRAQWEWKLPTDKTLQQYFPKEAALAEQALPPLEAELRQLLAVASPHPSRDPATRGLQLSNTQEIVHQLAPAGLTANRAQPHQPFVAGAGAAAAAASAVANLPPAAAVPASAAAPAAVAAASSSSSSASSDSALSNFLISLPPAPLSFDALQSAWLTHLHALFATHSILHSNFVQSSLSALAVRAGADASAMQALQSLLSARTLPFGPLGQYLMLSEEGSGRSKAAQTHRATLAALFASGPSTTTAAMRAALSKGVSEEKRREIMKEFAVYDAHELTWKLRPGQP